MGGTSEPEQLHVGRNSSPRDRPRPILSLDGEAELTASLLALWLCRLLVLLALRLALLQLTLALLACLGLALE